MVNLVITNNDIGSIILKDAQFRDELLVFAGADTFVNGTILARKAVADAVTPAAGSNTGDGTVTLATVVAGSVVPLVGAYLMTFTTAVANGGIFKLEDPNGAQVASDLIMTVGAGAATVFEVEGLEFTVTDGSTDFIVGDSFTLTVAADGKMLPFLKTGAGGVQVPSAVLTYDLTRTGAGNEPIRAMIAGSVRKERLVIDIDGDGSNVDDVVLDQLRQLGIVSIDTQELNIQDNQ